MNIDGKGILLDACRQICDETANCHNIEYCDLFNGGPSCSIFNNQSLALIGDDSSQLGDDSSGQCKTEYKTCPRGNLLGVECD